MRERQILYETLNSCSIILDYSKIYCLGAKLLLIVPFMIVIDLCPRALVSIKYLLLPLPIPNKYGCKVLDRLEPDKLVNKTQRK